MKKNLIDTVEAIATLLALCSLDDQADWFRAKGATLRVERIDSPKFQEELRDIKRIIAGMGSFTDLSLTPGIGSGLNREEARLRQWELAEQLDVSIQMLLDAERSPATA